MLRTHIVFDNLEDPEHGRLLSLAWARAGFRNVVDVSGQRAWLEPMGQTPPADTDDEIDHSRPAFQDGAGDAEARLLPRPTLPQPLPGREGGSLTEDDIARAAAIARAFGVEVRERMGAVFRPDNDGDAIHAAVTHDQRRRAALALMYGLPALALHHLGPVLAAGGDRDARAMVYPWFLQMALTGWLLWAVAWPVLWQGGLALLHLRATSDLAWSALLLGAWLPSALGVLAMPWVREPWFGLQGPDSGPTFHVAAYAAIILALQRWRRHAAAPGIAGRADWMVRGYSRFVGFWLLAAGLAAGAMGFRWGLAVLMLLPPALAAGCVHPASPGPAMLLPVAAFAGVFTLGRAALGPWGVDVLPVRFEVAFIWQLLMTMVFVGGWRKLTTEGAERKGGRIHHGDTEVTEGRAKRSGRGEED